MKYPIHNPFFYILLRAIDLFLSLLPLKKRPNNKKIQKILLVHPAHLGDVILMTSLLAPLKESYPEAEIGVLVGSWAQEIVKSHPLINYVHLIDHWKMSRHSVNRVKKWLNYLRTYKQALKEIKAQKYELALACATHFPNMALLLWRAGIPTRLGFESAGFSPLLTYKEPWLPKNCSVADSFYRLVQKKFSLPHRELKPYLAFTPVKQRGNYIVIHMGAGDVRKEWPIDRWRSLAQKLEQRGHLLHFTGQGQREQENIESVTEGLSRSENLANQLSWGQFVERIAQAKFLLSVDTVAGHIASATDTPALILNTGIHFPALWKPLGKKIHLLSKPLLCSPCFRGCKEMHCLKELEVDKVIYYLSQHLASS